MFDHGGGSHGAIEDALTGRAPRADWEKRRSGFRLSGWHRPVDEEFGRWQRFAPVNVIL
jgi:hypothetical protein